MLPAFVSAMQDRALRGTAREVYLWLHERLDVLDFRPIKHSAISVDLGMKEVTVSWAVTRLVERGYLARGPRDGRLTTYRLLHSRPINLPGLE
jgi:hypothetical protein